MDNSTDNVTLYAMFINDILENYKDNKSEYAELFKMIEGYDLSDPYNKVPIKLYNDLCAWLEANLGKFSLIKIGRQIGETIYTNLVTNKILNENATPIEIMQSLKKIANEMVQDPKGRGWVITKNEEKKLIMKRAQTFNSKLQLGLLDGLIRKSGVFLVKVDYVKSVERGDEFDEYLISWSK